jgi:hypothetical protein
MFRFLAGVGEGITSKSHNWSGIRFSGAVAEPLDAVQTATKAAGNAITKAAKAIGDSISNAFKAIPRTLDKLARSIPRTIRKAKCLLRRACTVIVKYIKENPEVVVIVAVIIIAMSLPFILKAIGFTASGVAAGT